MDTTLPNLIARELAAKYRQSHPHWVGCDSPLKYVDWALDETLTKCQILAGMLSPPRGSRVFEFGPGTGYLLYILRTAYGCDVAGCDVPDRPLYREAQERLGITTVVDEPVVPRRRVAALSGVYDYLIATQISWMDAWHEDDLAFFLLDCQTRLALRGRLVLFFNPQAFQGRDMSHVLQGCHPQHVNLPWLGQGVIL